MNYIPNVDTICLLIDIENYEENAKEILSFLEEQKNIAKVGTTQDTNYKHIISIGDMTFQILNNGTKGYSYILQNDGYRLNIAQHHSKIKSFSPIQVRISSEFLWSNGLINSWNEIKDWIESIFGNIIENKVFRLDLCLHISEMDFVTDYQLSYKGKFKKHTEYYTGLDINSLCFGTRKGKNIYCRIYNKTLEIQETKSKAWFKEIWQKHGLAINNVWNLEFEIKSEFLREFNVHTITDVLSCVQDIWKYCTTVWLQKIDRINTRVERCPINKYWLIIQNAFNSYSTMGLIKREKQLNMDADILIPNIIGNITSYSARKNVDNVNQVFHTLQRIILDYFKDKNTTFETEVNRKKKSLEISSRKGVLNHG